MVRIVPLILIFLLLPGSASAMETYRIANALKPDHNEVLHRQAMALEKLGRVAEAERVFTVLAQRDPQNGHWFSHLYAVQDARGKEEEAFATLQTAHRLQRLLLAARGWLWKPGQTN